MSCSALFGIYNLVGELQTAHRIAGVCNQAVVFWCDPEPGKVVRQCGTADKYGKINPGLPQFFGRDDHLLRRFDEQAGQPDHVRVVLLTAWINSFGGTLMPRLITL